MKPIFLLAFLPAMASAVPINGAALSFDVLKPGEQVLNYYSGGFGSQGTGPGPVLGISFTNGIAADPASIAFGPSAAVTGPSVTMTLDTPWSDNISFYFTGSGTIAFYSGTNASGNLLQSFPLNYPPFFPFGARPGPFLSAVFTPAANSTLRLDSITLSSSLVIPEPATSLLLAGGLLLLIPWRRVRIGS